MLKRLHARSEWKNLFVCGDSTVMATGAPATVVSGVGAANMVLRSLDRRDRRGTEYDRRKFPHQFVEFVDTPYRRPAVGADEEITPQNAAWAAGQCQGCEEPACVRDCPAHIDIPGVLRRMEAGNFTGAARELHLASPFGGLCGTVCPAGQLCERYCYRRSFAGQPVRIAELLRWVAGTASFDSGLRPSAQDAPLSATSNRNAFGARVAVLGGNLAGWTCAAYLALAGWQVDVLDSHDLPTAVVGAARAELETVLGLGVRFLGGQQPARFDAGPYAAVCLASDEWAEQWGLTEDSKLFIAAPDAHALSPAAAIAAGRAAAF